MQVPTMGASYSLCQRTHRAGSPVAISRDVREQGEQHDSSQRREGCRRCPTWKGKELPPTPSRQGLDRGTGSSHAGSTHTQCAVPPSCTASTHSSPQRPARCLEPRCKRSASPAAEQLAAACSQALRASSLGPPSTSPSSAPLPSRPQGDEKLPALPTWDEEQGSGGGEDDPAGRMVHLGAAVGSRLICLLACCCRRCFRLR